jgi:hypothetical protein
MNRTPDDAERLLALLVAICGEQISDYRQRIEVLVATLIANRRFVKPDSASRATADEDGHYLLRRGAMMRQPTTRQLPRTRGRLRFSAAPTGGSFFMSRSPRIGGRRTIPGIWQMSVVEGRPGRTMLRLSILRFDPKLT